MTLHHLHRDSPLVGDVPNAETLGTLGMSVGAGLKAGWLWVSRGFGYFVGAPIPLSPKPGQGPPEWLRRAGKFRVALKATSATGEHAAMVDVRGRAFPSTSSSEDTADCLKPMLHACSANRSNAPSVELLRSYATGF